MMALVAGCGLANADLWVVQVWLCAISQAALCKLKFAGVLAQQLRSRREDESQGLRHSMLKIRPAEDVASPRLPNVSAHMLDYRRKST